MFFSQKNLRALCILLSVAVLHACASYSRVEIPVDAAWLAKQGAGVIVYRGVEYPIMKPRASEDTLIFSRVNMRLPDGTLGYLTEEDMLPNDRGYRVHVDSSYELLTRQPVLHVPNRVIAKAEMDIPNPEAVAGNMVLVLIGGLAVMTVIAYMTMRGFIDD